MQSEVKTTEKDSLRKFINDNLTTGKYATECIIFLYKNKDKAFSENEIWENIKNKIDTSAPNAK